MTKQLQTELSQQILASAKTAVAEAIETHRRMGRSIGVSENGVIKRIRPQDIEPRELPHDVWERENA